MELVKDKEETVSFGLGSVGFRSREHGDRVCNLANPEKDLDSLPTPTTWDKTAALAIVSADLLHNTVKDRVKTLERGLSILTSLLMESSTVSEEQQKIEKIGCLCHELWKGYMKATTGEDHPGWADAPQWQKDSVISGVKWKIANPTATPKDQHNEWMRHKLADGWKHGLVKNPETKEHPCLVEYEELPLQDRIKDEVFTFGVAEGCLLF